MDLYFFKCFVLCSDCAYCIRRDYCTCNLRPAPLPAENAWSPIELIIKSYKSGPKGTGAWPLMEVVSVAGIPVAEPLEGHSGPGLTNSFLVISCQKGKLHQYFY